MSPYALLTGALLALLAAPLIWMACRVARDHALAGGAFAAGLAWLMVSLHAHHGTRLVDITFGVVAIGTAALLVATTAGVFARRHGRASAAASSALPVARVHRPQ